MESDKIIAQITFINLCYSKIRDWMTYITSSTYTGQEDVLWNVVSVRKCSERSWERSEVKRYFSLPVASFANWHILKLSTEDEDHFNVCVKYIDIETNEEFRANFYQLPGAWTARGTKNRA